MAKNNEVVPVLFRADRTGDFKGDVTAVFPTLPAELNGYGMTCYSHVGQHGACSMEWYRTTRAATPAEYRALQMELESAPFEYLLRIVARISPAMRAECRANARRSA